MRAPRPDDDPHDTFTPVSAVKEERYTLWLTALLCALGTPGVAAVAWQLCQRIPGSALAPGVLPVLAAVQGVLVLAAVAFFGAWLTRSTGLQAPWLQQLLQGARQRSSVLQHSAMVSLGAGVAGAAWLVTLAQLTPEHMPDPLQALPLWVKLLYGGITETVLVQWGVMSTLLFALWRLRQPEGGAPRLALVWTVIALSAAAQALLHLPGSWVVLGGLAPDVIAYTLLSQSVLGLLLGYIYWRHGLEAAIVAHILTLALSHGLT